MNGRFIEVNKALEKLTGYAREELIGSEFVLVLADTEKGWEAFNIVVEKGFARDLPITFRHKSGKTIETLANGTLVRNKAGEPQSIFAAARDITKLKQAEEERFALANRVQALLDSTEEGILGLDKVGRIVFINRAAADMLGYTPEQILGKEAHSLIHHHFADGRPYPLERCPIRHVLQGQKGVRVENEVFWTFLGCSIPVEYMANPIYYNGEVVGVVEVFTDITERKRSEEALKQTGLEIRRAYADVFFAVTGGRLALVTDEEMRSLLGQPVMADELSISEYKDLSAARERLRIAIDENFPEARPVAEELIIAASEALSNAVKHAHGGTYMVFKSAEGLQVLIHDTGPGIDFKTLPKATLLSGFSTTQTMGLGFSIMLEICSRVLISTQPGSTSIVLEQKLPIATEEKRWELRAG